ncbi:MAG: 1-acyl-sn-glycerol-3-phosphate acyltransferase [Bacteroidales bacterium]|nr:1-acyl-sn-glycerol-3-phosphate acyltransferase [Bacteroidales bacterium]
MMENINFEDIRPFNDTEVHDVLQNIINSEYFSNAVRFAFPNISPATASNKLLNIKTIKEFQIDIMSRLMLKKIKETSSALTFSGFEKLTRQQPNLFIANHRDIVLDSAILQILLNHHDLETSAIAIGSNLMKYPFIDIVRLNKMFKIERSGKSRELLHTLQRTSQYMRYILSQQNTSIWLAQRNGRSKDGNDHTDTAVLKMITAGSDKSFVDNLNEMNITPLSISYEYESCDFMRTREIYISRRQEYVKTEIEDFESIYQGIVQWKGNIHLSVCDSITLNELNSCNDLPERNDKFRRLAHIIDRKIFQNYHLWKTNYIAFDILHSTDDYQKFYTESDRQEFLEYAHNGLQKIEGDQQELLNIFLEIYSNPVKNALL